MLALSHAARSESRQSLVGAVASNSAAAPPRIWSRYRSLHSTQLSHSSHAVGPRLQPRDRFQRQSQWSVRTSASTPFRRPSSAWMTFGDKRPSSSNSKDAQSPGDPALAPEAAKVEALEFRVSTGDALDLATTVATKEVLKQFPWHAHILDRILSFMGLQFEWGTGLSLVGVERISAFYLPIWLVDASVSVGVTGNAGSAEATFVTVTSRFPGHPWKPMDTLPLTPPPPLGQVPLSLLQYQMFQAHRKNRHGYSDPGYELYDPRKHLHPKHVKIVGGIPPPMPFTLSPLHLPELFREFASDGDLTLKVKLPDEPQQDPDEIGDEEVGADHDQASSLFAGHVLPELRLQRSELKVDVLAAYPILMPLHLAELYYTDPGGRRCTMNYVVGAWDERKLTLARWDSETKEWRGTQGGDAPFHIDIIEVFPRMPIISDVTDFFAQHRRRLEEKHRKAIESLRHELLQNKERTRADAERVLQQEEDLGAQWHRDHARVKGSERNLIHTALSSAMVDRARELVERTSWFGLEWLERQAFNMRMQKVDAQAKEFAAKAAHMLLTPPSRPQRARAATEPKPYQGLEGQRREAELKHPDRVAGLGNFIHWSSPHVQRFSQAFRNNRKYLIEAMPEVLWSRQRMVNVAERGGNADHLILIDEPEGDRPGTSKTLRAADLEVRQEQDALRPQWLKQLEKGAAPGRR